MQALIDHYTTAKDWMCSSAYADELRWQESISLSGLDESAFLREYAWVVLNSGFRESVVRQRFDYISLCFCDWESADSIASNAPACVDSAYPIFRNRRKLEAIASTATTIRETGFDSVVTRLKSDACNTLQTFPFIGKVTSWHLAKNLGADVAKPDRHLVRLAQRFGCKDVWTMCEIISEAVGDRLSVTDLVLWRFEERRTSRAR